MTIAMSSSAVASARKRAHGGDHRVPIRIDRHLVFDEILALLGAGNPACIARRSEEFEALSERPVADGEVYPATMPDGTEGEPYTDDIARYERVRRLPRGVLA